MSFSPFEPTICRRRPKGKEITLEDIIQARDKCAWVIAQYGEQYLPIFERLEKEVALRKKQDELLQRALKIGTRKGTPDGTHLETANIQSIKNTFNSIA